MTSDLDERVGEYLRRPNLTARVKRVVPLTGDASDRRYLRLILDGTPSIVLAVHAGAIEYTTLPFVRVAALLEQVPLPVPSLLHHDDGLGIIGLQDLGDVTLQAHLGETTATERALRYRQAVGLIARLQQRGAELASDDYPPYAVAFDVEKLTWELEFFVTPLPAGLSRRAARPSRCASRSAKSGRPSPGSWPPNRACSATATTTAAT